MHAADWRALVIDGADQPGGEPAAVDHLLFPLTPKPGFDRVGCTGDIFRVDMPAHPKGIEMAKPALARAAKPVRQEIAIFMAKDDVRNDLRLSGILFDLAARPEAVVPTNAA